MKRREKRTNLMGRESSKESNEPNPFLPFKFNLLCTSSSLSLSSGVPIDDELSGSDETPPVKKRWRPSDWLEGGGDEGTSMVKVGPTKTSIFFHPKKKVKSDLVTTPVLFFFALS
uniref:Uncharacterized protein n=1 Tax=Medicago truncatula TaxID=3880 RepID=B7FMH3_MEDTR|nr:unknown [Medicago truncatula]